MSVVFVIAIVLPIVGIVITIAAIAVIYVAIVFIIVAIVVVVAIVVSVKGIWLSNEFGRKLVESWRRRRRMRSLSSDFSSSELPFLRD